MSDNSSQIKSQIEQTRYTKTVIGKIKAFLRKAYFSGNDALDLTECLRFLQNMDQQADLLLGQLRKGEPVDTIEQSQAEDVQPQPKTE